MLRRFLLLVLLSAAPLALAQTFTDVSNLLPERSAAGFAGAAIADVDRDGRTDVVRYNELFLRRDGVFDPVRFGFSSIGSVFGDVNDDGLGEALILFAVSPDVYQYEPAREKFGALPGGGIDVGSGFSLTQGSILLDYDRDGALDVLIGNDGGIDLLFRGAGDGTFSNESTMLPQIERGDYGMMAADYDRDGDTDVYVGICAIEPNLLYRNDKGVFSEVAAETSTDDARRTWGVVWFDSDNDGWFDLFVANMPPGDGMNGLFYNNADGTFTDVAEAAGVADPEDNSWTATAADFDNDGWVDLFVANDPETVRLYRNNADGTFSDITEQAGLATLSGAILASGDVNDDGWVDLYMPGGSPENRDALFFNDGGTNGWLTVDLTGVASNPDGVGARVEVAAGDLQMVREITAGDGFMSHSHGLTAHFGLGTATTADVTIHWPSGAVDMLEGVAASQKITVVEGVGRNEPPAMFALTAPADGTVVPPGEPVTLRWDEATDADAVTYTVHLAAPDGADATFETDAAEFEIPGSALVAEGGYEWAVVARDAYSARTSLDNASFTNDSNVASETAPDAPAFNLEVWPNPARETATVQFELAAAEQVWLEVMDVLGRRVQRLDLGVRSAGRHDESLVLEALKAGTYIVRLRGAESGETAASVTRVE